ncbi:MAG: transcriptional regulator [Chloroflexaceae bacterium]|nr:transcriptional regulator [Chloroflexaceae bacterium]
MSQKELDALIVGGESDRVEFKAIAKNNADTIKQTICAFANDLPKHQQVGVIVIGLHDDSRCADTDITDEMLTTLAHWQRDILPFPDLDVQKRTMHGCSVAIVTVHPHPNPPLRYNGRVYIRVGPTTRVADSQQEQRLIEKRRAGNKPFDLHPVYGATRDDLHQRAFHEYLALAIKPDVLAQNSRSYEQKLASLRFIMSIDDPTPTVLGIITIGTNPSLYIPGSYIQFIRYDGITILDPIQDQQELRGTLLEILRQLDEKLSINVRTALRVGSQPTAQAAPDYPIVALQQIARNAILHRNYESSNAPVYMRWFADRVEITSPGGLFGNVTRANFGTGVTDYRNPNIAEVMKNLGYVERFGFGLAKAQMELQANGNPPLAFDIQDTTITVVLRRTS